MQRIITLGNGKQIGLGIYVEGWKSCRQAPHGTTYKHGLCGWGSETRETILHQFARGLHDRINHHIPGYGQGRKWSHNWFMQAWRISRDVNTPRLIVHWIPKEFHKKLQHRLWQGE